MSEKIHTSLNSLTCKSHNNSSVDFNLKICIHFSRISVEKVSFKLVFYLKKYELVGIKTYIYKHL